MPTMRHRRSLECRPDMTAVFVQLRAGMQQAVESLGNQLLAQGDSTLIKANRKGGQIAGVEFLPQLLRRVFRRLLHMMAEARGLSLATAADDTWDEECLSLTPVDAGALPPETLGRLYEALLDLQPVVATPARSFHLIPTANRKRTGSFYTPAHLIECLLESALEPVLEEAANKSDPAAALLDLKICDPACGSGYFLLAAARRTAQRLAAVRRNPKNGAAAREIQLALREVIACCIYGMDIDPLSVELCKAALWLEAGDSALPLTFLDQHIVCGNSLLTLWDKFSTCQKNDKFSTCQKNDKFSTCQKNDKFSTCQNNDKFSTCQKNDKLKTYPTGYDVVLGNPPYGIAQSPKERAYLNSALKVVQTTANSAADFLMLAQQLIHDKGRVGLVVPKSLTYSCSWEPVRAALTDCLTHVVDVSKAWPDVLLEQVLVTYGNKPTPPATPMRLGQIKDGRLCWSRNAAAVISRLGILPTGLTDADVEILTWDKFSTCPSTLGSICKTQRGTGLQKYVSAAGEISVLAGKDLADCHLRPAQRFISSAILRAHKVRLTDAPQAVFQNIIAHIKKPRDHVRLIGAVATQPYACLDTVNLLTLTTPAVSPWALTAYLSSDLINWFVYVGIYNRAIRTMHFDGYFLKKIPIPALGAVAELDSLGRELAESPFDTEHWKRLNEAVFAMFAIPAALADYVTAQHKPRWR